MASIDTAEVLANERARFPSTDIAGRPSEALTYDVGALLAVDPEPINPEEWRRVKGDHAAREELLRTRAREATQLLMNQVWALPVERGTLDVIAELPRKRTVIPRMTRAPTPKVAETRHEIWLKEQGVRKRTKRERYVFDEATGEQRPRWGMGRVNSANDEWVIEHRNTEAHHEAVAEGSDPFALKQKEKKERVQEQRQRQSRNVHQARIAMGDNSAKLGKSLKKQTRVTDSVRLDYALKIAQKSSASMGKFDNLLDGEKKIRRPVQHRSVAPAAGGNDEEKGASMKVLDRVLRGPVGSTPDLIRDGKAANQAVTQQSSKRAGQIKKSKGRR